MNNLARLYEYYPKYKVKIIAGIFCVLASNIMAILIPYLIAETVDSVKFLVENPAYLGTDYVEIIWLFGASITLSALISAIFRFYIRQTLIVMSREQEYDLRQKLWNHVQGLSQRFFKQRSVGDIMAHLTNDIDAVRMFLGPVFMYSFDNICKFVLIIILLCSYDWKLTLISLLPMPLISVMVLVVGKQIHKRFLEIQESFSEMTAQAQQGFAGIRVIKSYVREDYENKSFEDLSRKYLDKQLRLVRFEALFRPGLYLISGASIAIIIYFGGNMVIDDFITIGQLIAFVYCLEKLLWPMIALGWIVNITQRAAASMKRLNQIFDTKPDIVDNNQTDQTITELSGDIEMRSLCFRYDDANEDTLSNIDLQIESGETVGIIGRTGSGKSSLIQLIPRIYDINSGELFIGGKPIKDIPIKTLRASIALAPQEPFLFSDTIANNIRFSKVDATEEELIHASKIAQFHSDLEAFPQKYETMVGERGITLSGGQKQRCSLARALLKKPKILILDDSFSAVDTQTEDLILNELSNEVDNLTLIIISHRVSTIKNADKIIVIDEGRIVEQGSHEELLNINGLYSDIYNKQLIENELETI